MNSTTTLASILVTLLAAGCSSSAPASSDNNADSGGGDDAATTGDDAGDEASGPAYPSGPYGVTVGKILDPSLQWEGFIPGATTASMVKVTDLYDPDGSKGLTALVVESAGQWCIACQGVAQEVPTWMGAAGENWKKMGVQILTLVIQNNAYEPATVTTAQQWRDLFKETMIYDVADPTDTFPTQSLPSELLVDPRTMKVVHDLSTDQPTTLNNDGSDPVVTALAKKNGG